MSGKQAYLIFIYLVWVKKRLIEKLTPG